MVQELERNIYKVNQTPSNPRRQTMESAADKSSEEARPSEPSTLGCSIGIMAYNEGANIGQLLKRLVEQRSLTGVIREIVVVASGCTDNTESVVREIAVREPRVRLLTQSCREGKASAINLFLGHTNSEILVLVGADTLPAPDAIQHLIEPFANPEVGMTGGRPIPVNDPRTFMGFAAHLLWELHHYVALKSPKLGELTSFRRVFRRIPIESAVDEANMEGLVFGQGYRLVYVPEAVVLNRGPKTIKDFIRQRRRVYAGHLRMHRQLRYQVATASVRHILPALAQAWQWNWRFVLWTPLVIMLEAYGRLLGWFDLNVSRRDHAIWEIAATTKEAIE